MLVDPNIASLTVMCWASSSSRLPACETIFKILTLWMLTPAALATEALKASWPALLKVCREAEFRVIMALIFLEYLQT